MRIAKPILMVSTPLGAGLGLFEAFRVGRWLGLLMIVLIGAIVAFSVLTVNRIRDDRRNTAQHTG